MNAFTLQPVFEGHPVGTLLIEGQPYFVGRDVCARLGYTNTADAMSRHCKGVVKRYPLQTEGGLQEVRVLSEPDVLRLIVRSKRPEAQKFEAWLFEEVLPAIRRSGGYVLSGPGDTLSDIANRALLAAEEALHRQAVALDTLAPKAAAYDQLTRRDGAMSLTDAAKTLGWRRDRFISALHAAHWIYRRQPEKQWIGHADKERTGYVVHRTSDIPDSSGRLVTRAQVLITAKGLARLAAIPPEWEAASC